jgi:hypothetical protein
MPPRHNVKKWPTPQALKIAVIDREEKEAANHEKRHDDDVIHQQGKHGFAFH